MCIECPVEFCTIISIVKFHVRCVIQHLLAAQCPIFDMFGTWGPQYFSLRSHLTNFKYATVSILKNCAEPELIISSAWFCILTEIEFSVNFFFSDFDSGQNDYYHFFYRRRGWRRYMYSSYVCTSSHSVRYCGRIVRSPEDTVHVLILSFLSTCSDIPSYT